MRTIIFFYDGWSPVVNRFMSQSVYDELRIYADLPESSSNKEILRAVRRKYSIAKTHEVEGQPVKKEPEQILEEVRSALDANPPQEQPKARQKKKRSGSGSGSGSREPQQASSSSSAVAAASSSSSAASSSSSSAVPAQKKKRRIEFTTIPSEEKETSSIFHPETAAPEEEEKLPSDNEESAGKQSVQQLFQNADVADDVAAQVFEFLGWVEVQRRIAAHQTPRDIVDSVQDPLVLYEQLTGSGLNREQSLFLINRLDKETLAEKLEVPKSVQDRATGAARKKAEKAGTDEADAIATALGNAEARIAARLWQQEKSAELREMLEEKGASAEQVAHILDGASVDDIEGFVDDGLSVKRMIKRVTKNKEAREKVKADLTSKETKELFELLSVDEVRQKLAEGLTSQAILEQAQASESEDDFDIETQIAERVEPAIGAFNEYYEENKNQVSEAEMEAKQQSLQDEIRDIIVEELTAMATNSDAFIYPSLEFLNEVFESAGLGTKSDRIEYLSEIEAVEKHLSNLVRRRLHLQPRQDKALLKEAAYVHEEEKVRERMVATEAALAKERDDTLGERQRILNRFSKADDPEARFTLLRQLDEIDTKLLVVFGLRRGDLPDIESRPEDLESPELNRQLKQAADKGAARKIKAAEKAKQKQEAKQKEEKAETKPQDSDVEMKD